MDKGRDDYVNDKVVVVLCDASDVHLCRQGERGTLRRV